MIDNNPLKQYFRRPAIFIKLPSGCKDYPDGVIELPESGELPVYPMTAIDDITTKTPDALYNGTAIAELIKSCIPGIKEPWKITSVDLDAILIAIRSASSGNDMEIETQCPACEEVATYGVNLVGLLSTLKAGEYDKEVQINDLIFKFRPLNFKEMTEASLSQFDLQRMFDAITRLESVEEKTAKNSEAIRTITTATMKVLSKTIEYIKTPAAFVNQQEYILDFIQNCDKTVFERIKEHNATLKVKSEVQPLKVKCIHCAHEYSQAFSVNASDFFG